MDTVQGLSTSEVSKSTSPNYTPKMLKCVAREGDEQVKLVAELRSWPKPNIRWFKNDKEIKESSKHSLSSATNMTELVIHEASPDDSSIYTVVASTVSGQESISTQLAINASTDKFEQHPGETFILPPVLLQPLNDQFIRVGTKVHLTVVAASPPEPEITWFKNDLPVQNNEKYRISQEGGVGILELVQAEASDEGIWKCVVVTGYGRALSSCKLKIGVPKGYRPPEFLEPLKAWLTEQGTVSLECKVIGIPTPCLKWFKDGQEIKAGDMFNLVHKSEEDSSLGIYMCEASNCLGTATSTAQVTVKPGSKRGLKDDGYADMSQLEKLQLPPMFIDPLEDQTVRIGDRIRLGITIQADPPATLNWYNKTGEVTETSGKYHFIPDQGGVTRLDIDPIEVVDEGEWRCVATNSNGQATSKCYISLTIPKNYKKPRFLEELNAVLSEEGTVSFECKVVGVPTPVLKWFKDGAELKPGDVYQLTGANSLGSYACVACNCMGSANSITELTLDDVQGKRKKKPKKEVPKLPPQFIIALKDEEVKIGEEMHLSVSVNVPPEPEVDWFKDDDKVEDTDRYHINQIDSGKYSLDVFPVDISDQGQWRCVATNDFGFGSTNCNVKIIIPKHYTAPKFIEELRASLSDKGTVSLECKVVGVPQPTLIWFKDGEELKAGDIYRIMSSTDGTSCLGTYTCEARNCMGTASSTVALLAFEDQLKEDKKKEQYKQELSTIEEKSEYSSYATASLMTDNWEESKAELEFSIYETPDITEDEARQIIEAFADQVSEHVSSSNISELPPLRFIKESAMVGNILMEAVIIDVPIDICGDIDEMSARTPMEGLETQAGIDDISATEAVVVDLPYELSSVHDRPSSSREQMQATVSPGMQEALIIQSPFQCTDLKSLSEMSDSLRQASFLEGTMQQGLVVESHSVIDEQLKSMMAPGLQTDLTAAELALNPLLPRATMTTQHALTAEELMKQQRESGSFTEAQLHISEAAAVQVQSTGKEWELPLKAEGKRGAFKDKTRVKGSQDSEEERAASETMDTDADVSSMCDTELYEQGDEILRSGLTPRQAADLADYSHLEALQVEIPDVHSASLESQSFSPFLDDRATPVASTQLAVLVDQPYIEGFLETLSDEQKSKKSEAVTMGMKRLAELADEVAKATCRFSTAEAVAIQKQTMIESTQDMGSDTDRSNIQAESRDATLLEAMQIQMTRSEQDLAEKSEIIKQEGQATATVQDQKVFIAKEEHEADKGASPMDELSEKTAAEKLQLGVTDELRQESIITDQVETKIQSDRAEELEISELQALIVQELQDLKASLRETSEMESLSETLADIASVSLNEGVIVAETEYATSLAPVPGQEPVTELSATVENVLAEQEATVVTSTYVVDSTVELLDVQPAMQNAGEQVIEAVQEKAVVQENRLEKPEETFSKIDDYSDASILDESSVTLSLELGDSSMHDSVPSIEVEAMNLKNLQQSLLYSATDAAAATTPIITYESTAIPSASYSPQHAYEHLATPVEAVAVSEVPCLSETTSLSEKVAPPTEKESPMIESSEALTVEMRTVIEDTVAIPEAKAEQASVMTPSTAEALVVCESTLMEETEKRATTLALATDVASEDTIPPIQPLTVVESQTMEDIKKMSAVEAVASEIADERSSTPLQAVIVQEVESVEKTEESSSKIVDQTIADERAATPLQAMNIEEISPAEVASTLVDAVKRESEFATQRPGTPSESVVIQSQQIYEQTSETMTAILPEAEQQVTSPALISHEPLVVEAPAVTEEAQISPAVAVKEEIASFRVSTPTQVLATHETTVTEENVAGDSITLTAHFQELQQWASEVGIRTMSPVEAVIVNAPQAESETTVSLSTGRETDMAEVTSVRSPPPLTDVAVQEPPLVVDGMKAAPTSVASQERENNLCSLQIQRTKMEDTGEYACIATNAYGEDATSATLFVRGHRKCPTFTKSLLNVSRVVGEKIVLSCTVIGRPLPIITWEKNGVPLAISQTGRLSASVDPKGTCELVIQNATKDDEGEYSCIAQNSLGRDEITAVVKIEETVLNGTSPPSFQNPPPKKGDTAAGETPVFITQLIDKIVLLGSTVVLQCEVSGTPKPDVTWLHNGQSIEATSHLRTIAYDDYVHTLTIKDISYSDLGIYSCRAANVHGVSYTTTCLTFGLIDEDMEFGVPAMFITRPRTITVERNEDIVLSVEVKGEPRPRVTWLKGARDVSNSIRAYKDVQGSTHKLVIHKAMMMDAGDYVVEAVNQLGKERCHMTVNVTAQEKLDESFDYRQTADILRRLQNYKSSATSKKELPGPVGGEPRVSEVGRNWATLLWPRPAYDGGSSILAYKIEARELPSGEWEEVGLSPITICDVYNLKSDCLYEFRVSARNKQGWGEPMTISSPVKIERKPHLPCVQQMLPTVTKARRGANITLTCVMTGQPDPEIKWYKNSTQTPLKQGPQYKMTYDGVTALLTIIGVIDEDVGEYICEAVNAAGRMTSCTRLTVVEEQEFAKYIKAGERPSSYVTPSAIFLDEPIGSTPEITMHLKDRFVRLDHLVRLSCQAQGNPTPTITWYKNKSIISAKDNCITFKDGSFNTLEITRAEASDAGEYKALATNEHGSVSTKCHLTVEGDIKATSCPTFIRQVEAKCAKAGTTVTLDAVIFNEPPSKVTWFKENEPIANGLRHCIRTGLDGRCSLTISNATAKDAGLYTIVASNELGDSNCGASLTIIEKIVDDTDGLLRYSPSQEIAHSGLKRSPSTEPKLPGYSLAPIFMKKPRSTEAIEGDTVELLCEVIGDPKPEVYWLRNGLRFEYHRYPERFLRLDDGPVYRLEIPYVTLDDTGTYAVSAENCHGETKAIISLQIFARGQGKEQYMPYRHHLRTGRTVSRPVFSQSLNNVRCYDGDTAILECRILSTPLPEIRWQKNGHVIHKSHDFRIEQENDICRLRIMDVYPDDAGEYTCVAYNDVGKVTTSAFLTVDAVEGKENGLCAGHQHSPKLIRKRVGIEMSNKRSRRYLQAPRFMTMPHNKVAEEGETVRFSCSASGIPAPRVTWDKDGKVLSSNGRIMLNQRDDLCFLEIHDVRLGDGGSYRIVLENTLGNVFALARLDVIGKKKVHAPSLILSPILSRKSYHHSPSPTSRSSSRSSSRTDHYSRFDSIYYRQRSCTPRDRSCSMNRRSSSRDISGLRNQPVIKQTSVSEDLQLAYDGEIAKIELPLQLVRRQERGRSIDSRRSSVRSRSSSIPNRYCQTCSRSSSVSSEWRNKDDRATKEEQRFTSRKRDLSPAVRPISLSLNVSTNTSSKQANLSRYELNKLGRNPNLSNVSSSIPSQKPVISSLRDAKTGTSRPSKRTPSPLPTHSRFSFPRLRPGKNSKSNGSVDDKGKPAKDVPVKLGKSSEERTVTKQRDPSSVKLEKSAERKSPPTSMKTRSSSKTTKSRTTKKSPSPQPLLPPSSSSPSPSSPEDSKSTVAKFVGARRSPTDGSVTEKNLVVKEIVGRPEATFSTKVRY